MRSAVDLAFTLRIILPWGGYRDLAFPSSPPTCVFRYPSTTTAMASRSRLLSDSYAAAARCHRDPEAIHERTRGRRQRALIP
jgi:hypothetical protein